METYELLKNYISENEGEESKVYYDSLGIPTIGVGFNLYRNDAKAEIENLGVSYDQLLRNEVGLSPEQIQILFNRTIESSIQTAKKMFFEFDKISTARQIILIDLAFNLGETKLNGFRKMIHAVKKRDWSCAAFELQDSSWFSQVGRRGPRNVHGLKMDILHDVNHNLGRITSPKQSPFHLRLLMYFRKLF